MHTSLDDQGHLKAPQMASLSDTVSKQLYFDPVFLTRVGSEFRLNRL